MDKTAQIAQLRAMARAFDEAETREEIGALYAQMVGYDCSKEDPDASLEDLRSLAMDYISETCVDAGIDCGDVLPDAVDDDTRSYGPWGAPPARRY